MSEIESLSKAVHDHLSKRVAEIVAVEAKVAAKRIEDRVMDEASQIAIKVVKRCTIERFGQQQLVISVDFQNTTQ